MSERKLDLFLIFQIHSGSGMMNSNSHLRSSWFLLFCFVVCASSQETHVLHFLNGTDRAFHCAHTFSSMYVRHYVEIMFSNEHVHNGPFYQNGVIDLNGLDDEQHKRVTAYVSHNKTELTAVIIISSVQDIDRGLFTIRFRENNRLVDGCSYDVRVIQPSPKVTCSVSSSVSLGFYTGLRSNVAQIQCSTYNKIYWKGTIVCRQLQDDKIIEQKRNTTTTSAEKRATAEFHFWQQEFETTIECCSVADDDMISGLGTENPCSDFGWTFPAEATNMPATLDNSQGSGTRSTNSESAGGIHRRICFFCGGGGGEGLKRGCTLPKLFGNLIYLTFECLFRDWFS